MRAAPVFAPLPAPRPFYISVRPTSVPDILWNIQRICGYSNELRTAGITVGFRRFYFWKAVTARTRHARISNLVYKAARRGVRFEDGTACFSSITKVTPYFWAMYLCFFFASLFKLIEFFNTPLKRNIDGVTRSRYLHMKES